MSKDAKMWLRGNLEVIVNQYKELEDEIRAVRQSYEVELRRINCELAIMELDDLE